MLIVDNFSFVNVLHAEYDDNAIEKIYSPKPNLSKIETWSSYEECRKLNFYLNENNILD